MPGRFSSPECPRCAHPPEKSERETISHRYVQCDHVSEAWEWLKYQLFMLDMSLASLDDLDILKLNFDGSLRDNAVIWMIGI